MHKIITCIFLFNVLVGCKSESEELIDLDGNQYPIIRYGETDWMAENLRVAHDADGQPVSYFFPGGDSTNVLPYGLLYDFENACKVCPEGWRLPNNQEWEELFDFTSSNVANRYKDSQYWKGEKNTNSSKFSARPAGIGNNQEHPNNFNDKTLFWSNSKEDKHFIWTYILEKGESEIRKASQHPTYAFSVRCVKAIK